MIQVIVTWKRGWTLTRDYTSKRNSATSPRNGKPDVVDHSR